MCQALSMLFLSYSRMGLLHLVCLIIAGEAVRLAVVADLISLPFRRESLVTETLWRGSPEHPLIAFLAPIASGLVTAEYPIVPYATAPAFVLAVYFEPVDGPGLQLA